MHAQDLTLDHAVHRAQGQPVGIVAGNRREADGRRRGVANEDLLEELFEWLDAPVRRVAALDSFVAYHPTLEDTTLPQAGDVAAAITALARY